MVTWSFVLAKDGSIHRAPICDMVPEGYHHRLGNGLILRCKFRHSKKFVLFIYTEGKSLAIIYNGFSHRRSLRLV